MNAFAIIPWLMKGSLVIAAGYLILAALVRFARIESPAVRQFGVVVILLAAVWPWRMPLEVPCLPAGEAVVPGANISLGKNTSGLTDLGSGGLAEIDFGGEHHQSGVQQSGMVVSARPAFKIPWRALLTLLFVAGPGFIFLRALAAYVKFLVRTRQSLPAPAAWQGEWQQLQQDRLGRELIPLYATFNLGPLLARLPRHFGLFIPVAYWQELSTRQRRTILRHELAHYQRGDVWRACGIRLLALPFWFHPLAWRLIAMFDEAAEDACDQAAIGNQRQDSVPFAQALECLAAAPYPAISLAMGHSAQAHPLVQRVRRVLNPHRKDSRMKTFLSAVAVCALALVSLLQIRLVAEDKAAKAPASLETVKADIETLKGKLTDLKANVDVVKQDLMQFKERIEAKVQALKDLASDPANTSAEGKELVEDLKSGDEARQLKALAASDKLKSGDEKLIVCGYLAKDGATEAVRQKAIATAAAKGEEGLPVFVTAFEKLSTEDRVYAVEQLAKHKDTHPGVFARISQDGEEQVKVAAITAGLKTKDPLIFLALLGEVNEGVAPLVLPRLTILEKEDQRLALFALALKGKPELLPEIVDKAALLDERGYAILAVIFERKTPESRVAIVRAFAKTTNEFEGMLVTKARNDPDPKLREAAEKATDGFGATGIGAEAK